MSDDGGNTGAPDDFHEKVIRPNQTTRLLAIFRKRGAVTNRELNTVCFRYSARIRELRQDGHRIVTKKLHDGLFLYVYIGEAGDDVVTEALEVAS